MRDSARTTVPLPMHPAEARPLLHCTECGQCCTYVAVGVNAPTSTRFATDVLWYLYHDKVSVHRDARDEWAVVFETRCRNLGHDLLCGVYEQRPHICRGFDEKSCEVNLPDHRDRVFRAPREFLDFLREWRPRVYARVMRGYAPPALRAGTRVAPARVRALAPGRADGSEVVAAVYGSKPRSAAAHARRLKARAAAAEATQRARMPRRRTR